MATTTARRTEGRVTSGRLWSLIAVLAVLGLTVWAGTAGSSGADETEHFSPGTVEHVEGSDRAVVVLTPTGAEKIDLRLVDVEPVRHPAGRLVVPFRALIHAADGVVWVYATDGDPLRFRRQAVEVAAVEGQRAILRSGPPPSTTIASTGSAELYGTEFEVGH